MEGDAHFYFLKIFDQKLNMEGDFHFLFSQN